MDIVLLEQTIKGLKRAPLLDFIITESSAILSKTAIQTIIPHRDPFLLIDNIISLDLDKHLIKGERFISAEDPVFLGHFPNKSVYPGVLQIEMMAQLGLCLAYFILNNTHLVKKQNKPVEAVITKLHYAAFNAPVLPNQLLSIYAKMLHYDGMTGMIAGQIYCDNQLCSYSISEAYFND